MPTDEACYQFWDEFEASLKPVFARQSTELLEWFSGESDPSTAVKNMAFEVLESRLSPTCYVETVTVTDPDTGNPVEVEIRKILSSGAMVGIDGSYLEQDAGPVYDPYNAGGELEIPDEGVD